MQGLGKQRALLRTVLLNVLLRCEHHAVVAHAKSDPLERRVNPVPVRARCAKDHAAISGSAPLPGPDACYYVQSLAVLRHAQDECPVLTHSYRKRRAKTRQSSASGRIVPRGRRAVAAHLLRDPFPALKVRGQPDGGGAVQRDDKAARCVLAAPAMPLERFANS